MSRQDPNRREHSARLEELARAFAEALVRDWKDRLLSVVLYGSVARGEAEKHSDIDVLVTGDPIPTPYDQRLHLIRSAEASVEPLKSRLVGQGYFAELAVLIKRKEDIDWHTPILLDITEDGRILYDRGDYMKMTLDVIRSRLKALGSKRIHLPDGTWFWDLKPDYKPGDIIEI
ncbi:MAG: nucleotidyltransferase domain-containing protein [Nitrospirae bacterium]|nr:nucleotidyltransferase domain-containing protein [Nitrospirota bacterium]